MAKEAKRRNSSPNKEEKKMYNQLILVIGIPWWLSGKESACQYRRCGFNPWVRKIPWRKKWKPTPLFLPGKSHGQMSLVGYSPCGHRQLNTTELLTHTGGASGKESTCQCRRLKRCSSIPGLGRSPGGGNGNPLHYSCLENPTDRGAWWATVIGLQRVGHD